MTVAPPWSWRCPRPEQSRCAPGVACGGRVAAERAEQVELRYRVVDLAGVVERFGK